MRIGKRIKERIKQIEHALTERHKAEQGGVYVCESDEEFEELRKLPYVGPGEVGCLIVRPQEDLATYILRTTGKTLAAHEAECQAQHGEPVTEQESQ